MPAPRTTAEPESTAMHRTEDLFEAAYLLTEGCTLADTELVSSSSVRFVFSVPTAPDDLADLVRGYTRGEAVASVLALKHALTHLKDVMFARLRAAPKDSAENETREEDRWRSRSRRSRR